MKEAVAGARAELLFPRSARTSADPDLRGFTPARRPPPTGVTPLPYRLVPVPGFTISASRESFDREGEGGGETGVTVSGRSGVAGAPVIGGVAGDAPGGDSALGRRVSLFSGDPPRDAGSRRSPGGGTPGVDTGGLKPCIGGAMITAPGEVGELGAMGEVMGVVGAPDCAAHTPVKTVSENNAAAKGSFIRVTP